MTIGQGYLGKGSWARTVGQGIGPRAVGRDSIGGRRVGETEGWDDGIAIDGARVCLELFVFTTSENILVGGVVFAFLIGGKFLSSSIGRCSLKGSQIRWFGALNRIYFA